MITNLHIALISSSEATFVATDRRILENLGEVRFLLYRGRRDLLELARLVGWCDVVVCWFALGYSTSCVALASLSRKPTLLIVGGWDVVVVPAIGYGAMTTRSRIAKTTFALRKATSVLAFSESAKISTSKWVDREIRLGYLGVDTEFFSPSGHRGRRVVTVAGVDSETRFRRKGIDRFLAAAKLLPTVPFSIVGGNSTEWDHRLRSIAPTNVQVLGRLTREELREEYRKSWVYAQLSEHEGFGVALTEAMACGCVPVTTDKGALPEIVGDVGYLIPDPNAHAVAYTIERALADGQRGDSARSRAEAKFSIEARQEVLSNELHRIL